MVMKMKKSKFIIKLSEETGYSEEKCVLINNVLENYYIFSKNNKEKIIKDLQLNVNLNEDDAENVYDISVRIIKGEIKKKIKHPFKNEE